MSEHPEPESDLWMLPAEEEAELKAMMEDEEADSLEDGEGAVIVIMN